MEIERKWLIDGFPAGLPLLKEARVRQGYISTAPVVRIRESVNADGCRCVLCFKGEGTLAREEVETDISAELFRRLTAFTGQDLVTKDYRVYALPGGERLEVSLVAGVGATEALGSQPWSGNTAAFTPKPIKAKTYTARSKFL